MRQSRIQTSAVVLAAFAMFAVSAFPQTPESDTTVVPKHVLVEGDNHYDRMTAMGRLAYVVSKVRAQQPDWGRGRTLHAALAQIDPSTKPDACSQGDEDCDAEGFHDGPGATQSEMSIAVDQTGMHIVVGFNDFRGFANPQSLSGFAYSDDGGITFTDGGQLPPNPNGQLSNGILLPQVDGDPDVKWVPGGGGCQFIYSSILVVGLPKASAPNFTGTAQTMSLHRSSDCGHTWSGPFEVLPATNPTGVLVNGNARDAADKEFIDVDPDTGRVMLSWSNFTAGSVIPGGVQVSATFSDNIMTATPPTWSTRVVLNPGSATFDTGSMPRFAGAGSPFVYVAWATSSNTTGLGNTRVAKSADNGVTFGPSIALNAADFFPADQILGDDRIHSFPFMAVDTSAGPRSGSVYVAYLSNNNQDGGDIAFHKSSDGVTFTPATFINARPGNDRSQWFPVLAVDSSTGRINVMYDDQGIAASGDLMQMTWMSSDDGGSNWSKPSPLTRPFHAGYGNDTSQPNLGDYNGGATRNGAFYVAFTNVPNVVNFNDGQPSSFIGYPTFLGNTLPGGTAPAPGFAKVTGAKAALDLGPTSFSDSGGNGFLDSGESASFVIPLHNYVTNPVSGSLTYTGVSATLSTATPGVTIQQATSTYPSIAPGGVQINLAPYTVKLETTFVPGTKIDFSLAVATAQGSTTLLFTQNTGTPVATTIFSENFNSTAPGALPPGWGTIHVGGTPTVPWTTNNTFCGTGSNGLFHQNANDTTGTNRTRFERVSSPNITIPASSQYVTVDFDICYDTEDDPNFNILAYDGADLRITDFTPGHFARANFADALAESFTTGALQQYPKHNPRSSNSNYFQDISLWAGDSGGFKHVTMRFNGMAGDTIQLRPDFTQDSFGTCTDVRPTHLTCGVMIDNIVVKSIVSHVTIATASLPVAFVGVPYSTSLSALAGVPPYFWSITSGRLPAGLTLNSATGQISGTPTNASFSILTFQVMDSSAPPQTATVTLVLNVLANALSITTTSLPNGKVGVPYSQTLVATGGTLPYTWALNPGAALPNGLTLNPATGVISGTPTTPVTNFRVLVNVTDATTPVKQTSSAAYEITIN
jgi:hypothetical protein